MTNETSYTQGENNNNNPSARARCRQGKKSCSGTVPFAHEFTGPLSVHTFADKNRSPEHDCVQTGAQAEVIKLRSSLVTMRFVRSSVVRYDEVR